jgi:hypothetical protein
MADADDEWNGFSDRGDEADGPQEPCRPTQVGRQPWDVPDDGVVAETAIPNPKDSDFGTSTDIDKL